MKKRTLNPVSYTHLDVYKRQIKYIGEELDSEVFAELDEDTRELVVDILPTAALARAIEDLDLSLIHI